MSSAARAARRRAERSGELSPWRPDHEWEASVRQAVGEWDGEPPRCYRKGLLAAIVTRDRLRGDPLPRWHISVSHRDRVPTWEEMAEAAHELRPGVPLAIGVPPRSWWVNVHDHVLHLVELRDEPLVASWRDERRGDRPS